MKENIPALLRQSLICWDKLSIAEQQLLISNSAILNYQKNDSIHNADLDCIGVLFVLSGTIRIYINSPEGKEITLYRLKDGDLCLLSATCILKSITFDIHIDTISDCKIMRISSAAFAKVMENNVYLEAFAYRETAERFSDVMWTLQQILFMSFDKRLAIFLLDESNALKKSSINMTHEQIAKLIGSAREVVSRMLQYFASENLVQLSRGKITIIDKNGLQKLL